MDPSNPLAPIFAASVAVQQILEVLSVFVEKWCGEPRKKAVLGIIGFLVGLFLAYQFGLNVMGYLKVTSGSTFIDLALTALILSAGTEGTNSIVKFLKYLKEDKKATAAETVQMLRKRKGEATLAGPSSDAKRALEKLRARAGTTGIVPGDASRVAYTYISDK